MNCMQSDNWGSEVARQVGKWRQILLLMQRIAQTLLLRIDSNLPPDLVAIDQNVTLDKVRRLNSSTG